ncbi:MAG TPA: hypothetical protein VFF65_02670 [Phycisphaerales bacterium]|nr:hypothetical protein [Phycisphaerales bacterium]
MTLGYTLQTGDWLVLVVYVLLLLGAGWFLSRPKAGAAKGDTRGYFLASRSMPGWAVAISILATTQSAATFVGVPQNGFRLDFTYVLTSLGAIVAALVVAVLFLPAYYRLDVATPYQLLETRFGAGARKTASLWYLVGRMMANGARVYIGALPVAMALYGEAVPSAWQILSCVAVFMAFGAVFTLSGGVCAAIYSDVIQVAVYLGAAVVIIAVLLWAIPASPAEILHGVVHPSEGTPAPTWFRLGIGDAKPWTEFSLVAALTGTALLNIGWFATDQDLTQRLLACRSSAAAARSLIGSTVAVGLPVVLLFMTLGVLLNVYYTRADLMGAAGAAGKPEGDPIINFVFLHSPVGVAGLMFAGLLAAGPAGINSSLNSMASSFITDIYRPARPGREERHYVAVGRWATVAAGLVMGLFVVLCVFWQRESGKQLIEFALSVMVFAYAGLVGVFFCALFTRRGGNGSAIAAMIAGFVAVVAMQGFIWKPIVGARTPEELWSLAPWAALASPWQLCIGTALSFTVCALTAPRTSGMAGGGGAGGAR